MQKTRRTALIAAAGCGSVNVVRAILERDADVNDVTVKTCTRAAHEAAKNGHLQVLRVGCLHVNCKCRQLCDDNDRSKTSVNLVSQTVSYFNNIIQETHQEMR